MQFKRISMTSILALILAFAMVIGIIANLIKPLSLKSAALVIIGCVVVWYLKPLFLKWVKKLSEKSMTRVIYATMVAIIIIQVLVIHFLPVSVYHDPFRVLVQAEQLAHGNLSWHGSLYFLRFPNNVSLTVLMAFWLKLTSLVHLSTYWGIHLLSMILLDAFIFAMLRSVRRLSHQNDVVLLAALFFLISPFAYTYYLQVFYSDLPSMLSLAIVFNVLIGWQSFNRPKKILTGIGLVLSVILAEVVKPNLIVLLVAVLLVAIWLFFKGRPQLNAVKMPFILIILGFILAMPVSAGLKTVSHYKVNNDYTFPATHWIWMSYNPHGNGEYKFRDVKKLSAIPGKQAKQKYLNQALPKRLSKLGPVRIGERWIEKAGILLDVSTIQKAYTGGFIAAPKAYQKVEIPLATLGMVVMRVGFILLYSETLLRCVRLWRKRHAVRNDDPQLMLTILTALGYIAFHTLLWETESRYGQVMIPLLGILCSIPSLALPDERRITRRTKTEGVATATVLVLALAIFAVAPHGHLVTKGEHVAGQESQLSLQFDAKENRIQPGSTLTQQIKLNLPARKFKVSLAPGVKFRGILVNEQTHHRYTLVRTKKAFKLKRKLPMGKYRIELTNNQSRTQSILLTKTLSYRLAPYPLVINQIRHPYWSFVYTFSR